MAQLDTISEHNNRPSHTKATREDWIMAARDVLVSEGVGEVKILTLAAQLDVARSSFYWYFNTRSDLLNALLADWESRNTDCIIEKCASPAENLSHAICHFFECFIDPDLFDPGLDFAVREWSRRDSNVRAKIDAADARRLSAIQDLFTRFGLDAYEADARARILYFMQLGYHALDVNETLAQRLERIEGYLLGFSGLEADLHAVEQFKDRVSVYHNI
ncbi:MAG: TetR/AcrR family transcriptional regulator [Pseudomonadota bacterium]